MRRAADYGDDDWGEEDTVVEVAPSGRESRDALGQFGCAHTSIQDLSRSLNFDVPLFYGP